MSGPPRRRCSLLLGQTPLAAMDTGPVAASPAEDLDGVKGQNIVHRIQTQRHRAYLVRDRVYVTAKTYKSKSTCLIEHGAGNWVLIPSAVEQRPIMPSNPLMAHGLDVPCSEPAAGEIDTRSSALVYLWPPRTIQPAPRPLPTRPLGASAEALKLHSSTPGWTPRPAPTLRSCRSDPQPSNVRSTFEPGLALGNGADRPLHERVHHW